VIGPGDVEDVRNESPTRLRGTPLVLARVAWLALALLTLGSLVVALPYRYRELRTVCVGTGCGVVRLTPDAARTLRSLGLSVDVFAAYVTTVEVVLALTFVFVGALIYGRKSSDWMAIYVASTLVILGASALPILDALVAANPFFRVPVNGARALGLGALILLSYLFPNGQLVPGWTRWRTGWKSPATANVVATIARSEPGMARERRADWITKTPAQYPSARTAVRTP